MSALSDGCIVTCVFNLKSGRFYLFEIDLFYLLFYNKYIHIGGIYAYS